MPNLDSDLDFRNQEDAAEAAEGRRRDDAVRGPDSGPQDPEAMRAAEGLSVSSEEAAAYREHIERGAHQQGEGAPIV